MNNKNYFIQKKKITRNIVFLVIFLYLCPTNQITHNIIKKKYKLTEETIDHNGRTLYRIEAVKDFNDVKCGDKGGYVENEINLSHYSNAWVCGNESVFSSAEIK